MPLATDDLSRFQDNQTILFNGVETFGRWSQPSLVTRDLPDTDVVFFVVDNSNQGRPDIISNEIYGTPFLDWLVIAFNKPRSTLNWPRTGEVIRLPSQNLALAELT